MVNFKSNNKEVEYKHQRTVRVVAYFNNDSFSTGTGFFVSKTGGILTCWHILFGLDLKVFKLSDEYLQNTKNSEAEKVEIHFKNSITKIEVELPDGTKSLANLTSYDYYYDIAVLEIPNVQNEFPYFELEKQESLDYVDDISFCGYPYSVGYDSLNSPFAINVGVVSAFPEVDIAGGKYCCIQLNAICIGGNSGAPLFKNGSLKVFGIVNGYQWKGHEQIPINISFATGCGLLKINSNIRNIFE